MEQCSLRAGEVKEQGSSATLIEKWEKRLAEEGLSGELAPLIPEEVQELFPMNAEYVADDFEAVCTAADVSEDVDGSEVVCEEITLTAVERRIVERIKDLGWAATLEEANATGEQIARLADSGTAFLRATDSGETVLAMAGATNGDVARAALRIEKPKVRKFTPQVNRPMTPAVMFLDHHSDEKQRGPEALVEAANLYRQARRVAVARDILEAHAGRLTKEAKVEMFMKLFGESVERARRGGSVEEEGFRREVKRSLARIATEALVQIHSPRSARLTSWTDDPRSSGRFAERLDALSARRGWTSDPALRRSIEEQNRSGQARRNTARAIYTASLGYATHRVLHVLRRDGRTALGDLRRRFSRNSENPQEVNDALVKLDEAGKVRKLRNRKTGEVFVEAKDSIDEARYKQALRRIMASSKYGLRSSRAGRKKSQAGRNAA